MLKRSLVLVLAPFVLLCMSGCLHRSAAPLTPGQQVSLTLNQSLSIVATLNKSIAADVISINAQGIISKYRTNSILSWQKTVAQQILNAEAIQRSTATDAEKAVAIKNAFASVTSLPPDITALLRDPQTDQAVAGLVTTIQSIISFIRTLAGA